MSNQNGTVVCSHCRKIVDPMFAYRREETDTIDGLPSVWVYWLCVDCKDVAPDQVAVEYKSIRRPDDDPDAETVEQREVALSTSSFSPMGLSLARGHYVLSLTHADDGKLLQHYSATRCPLAGQELINRGYRARIDDNHTIEGQTEEKAVNRGLGLEQTSQEYSKPAKLHAVMYQLSQIIKACLEQNIPAAEFTMKNMQRVEALHKLKRELDAALAHNWNDVPMLWAKVTNSTLDEKYDTAVNLLDRIVSAVAEFKKYRTMRTPSFTQELNAALEAANYFLQSLRNDHGETE